MNYRLVSKFKSLKKLLIHDENSERYIGLKFELTLSLMRRDIEKVVKKYPNRPKLKKKLLNMYNAYTDLTYDEMVYICKRDGMM